jgi:hypothetical protein
MIIWLLEKCGAVATVKAVRLERRRSLYYSDPAGRKRPGHHYQGHVATLRVGWLLLTLPTVEPLEKGVMLPVSALRKLRDSSDYIAV